LSVYKTKYPATSPETVMAKAKIEITNGTQGRGFQVEKKLRMDVLKRRSEPVGGIAVMPVGGKFQEPITTPMTEKLDLVDLANRQYALA
jgi:hypothetical protein